MDRPIDHEVLVKQEGLPAEGRAERVRVELLDVAVGEHDEPQLVRENGRLRLLTDVGAGGLDVVRPFPDLEPVALNRQLAGEHLDVRELAGLRPSGVETRFAPAKAAPTHRLRAGGKDRDKGGTIFGSDDRFLFQDTSFPWRITGKVRTAGGWASGTMIGPRHVLTASHVVNWNCDGQGGVGWATFTPGYFDSLVARMRHRNELILCWHAVLVRCRWTLRRGRRPGRPPSQAGFQR